MMTEVPGTWWSEAPHVHAVFVLGDRDEVDSSFEPFQATCEAEACEVALDVVYECARVGVPLTVIVVALPEWVSVAEFIGQV